MLGVLNRIPTSRDSMGATTMPPIYMLLLTSVTHRSQRSPMCCSAVGLLTKKAAFFISGSLPSILRLLPQKNVHSVLPDKNLHSVLPGNSVHSVTVISVGRSTFVAKGAASPLPISLLSLISTQMPRLSCACSAISAKASKTSSSMALRCRWTATTRTPSIPILLPSECYPGTACYPKKRAQRDYRAPEASSFCSLSSERLFFLRPVVETDTLEATRKHLWNALTLLLLVAVKNTGYWNLLMW